MQKFLKNDFFVIILIFFIFILLLPFFFLHQGIFLVDIGREFYLSQQTAQGEVLYKDIFNIYGPFAYQFNAFLFKIFSEKILTLYIAGIINSFVIVISLYLISREFFKKNFSFLISIFAMFSLVFSTALFNTNIPYCYGLIYALSSFLISLLFLIKYVKSNNSSNLVSHSAAGSSLSAECSPFEVVTQKFSLTPSAYRENFLRQYFLYISCFFAGISIICKYEFLLYPLVLIYVVFFSKQTGIKTKIISILCFFTAPFISFAFLFFQGLTLNELKLAFEMLKIMVQSDSMRFFYSRYGNFFDASVYLSLILKNPFKTILGFLPVINIILFLVSIKKIYKNKALFVFCISSILASYKFILFLNIEHMGIFLLPLCLITLFVLCMNKKTIENLKYIILITLILFFAFSDFSSLKYKKYFVETKKGNIYTCSLDAILIEPASEFILKNSSETDTIVVLPEGAFINFITDRKTDNIYHNLYPMHYLDTFGEQNVIEHYTNNPPDYFVLMPITTIEYGNNFYFLCDYAQKFCEMIEDKYSLEKEEKNIKIYKRK